MNTIEMENKAEYTNKYDYSNNEFFEIIENIPDIIGIHSHGKVVFINKTGAEILKASHKDEIIGKPFLQFVHPDFLEIVKKRAEGAINFIAGSPIEEKFICLDGSLLEVEVKAIPIKFQQKDSVLIIARDITEKKLAQEDVKAERTLLRTIIDSVPESVYVKDSKGGKVIANTQDLLYMGLETEKDAIGKTDEDVYAKYNSAYFNKDDEYVIQDGKPVINKLDYFIDANNQQYWLLTSKVPIKNKHDEIIGLIGIGRDVTERQKIQEQLYEAQDRLSKITLSTTDWIWEIDADGILTYCSESVENITGYHPATLIGKSLFGFIHNNEKIDSSLNDLFQRGGNIIDQEYWITNKNSSEVCLLISGYPKLEKSGNLKGYVGVIKNITDRKNKEKKISELYEHLNILIEAIPDAIFFKDKEGKWLITNSAAKTLFNLAKVDWVGKTDSELAEIQPFYADIHNLCIITDIEAWKGKDPTFSYEIVKVLNSTEFQFHVTKVPVYDSNGARNGMVVIGRDITKNLIEEQRLKLMETVIENASDAITIVEINKEDVRNSKVIYVNKAGCEMNGREKEYFIGKTPRFFNNKKVDPVHLENISNAILKGESYKMELQDTRYNGEEYWSILSLTPVTNQEGVFTHWIGIKKDITEAKKHEQEIRKAIIQGQENEKYFISGELHDNVAQILIGAKLSLSMVKGKTDKEIEWLRQTNEHIDTSINEIRNLSHSLAPSAFYQKNLISSIEQLLRSINKENSYKISFNYDLLGDVEIDGELQLNIYRIIQEQLQNIIKHAQATKIKVSLKLADDNFIKLIINDNGKGFDTSVMSRGIGLQNIRNRAETFSGIYAIKSAPSKGCELQVTIPFK